MTDKIEALRDKADGLDTLLRERNLYKGKYRALLKLISKTRGKLVQVTDHIEDEGDRAYFGSTNQADELKELYHEMMSWIWDSVDETNRMKSDPYADIRKQRARAEKAEAELSRLRSSNEAMRKALERPVAWMRAIPPVSTPDGPGEWEVDLVYGEDEPVSVAGQGWTPLYAALSLQEEEAR